MSHYLNPSVIFKYRRRRLNARRKCRGSFQNTRKKRRIELSQPQIKSSPKRDIDRPQWTMWRRRLVSAKEHFIYTLQAKRNCSKRSAEPSHWLSEKFSIRLLVRARTR